jgi:hypothetical protein
MYKVTLHDGTDYKGGWILPLTIGVYPDIHRYSFGDHPSSVLFEEGTLRNMPKNREEFLKPYDVSSYYTPPK